MDAQGPVAASTTAQDATGNSYIDGLLSGARWMGTLTFSFPQSASDYPATYGDGEPSSSFRPVTFQQQEATRAALLGATLNGTANVQPYGSLAAFTNIAVTESGGLGNGLNGLGDIRLAESSAANPTAYAYYPNNAPDGSGGDVWFGNAYAGTPNLDYRNPVLGNYAYHTLIHELGHALGLKHSQEAGGPANVAVPSDRDAIEFTVMSYRSYVGAAPTGYTYETFGAPQTYMMLDILALQTMYGADYGTYSGSTVYRWNPATGQMSVSENGGGFVGQGIPGANRVFMTVWDGGGIDTYDMSNYANGVSIDLRPGQWSITSDVQRAYLGNGHYANGTVYNAYLFGNNPASLIENAIGGAGGDTIVGNEAGNVLDGGAGADVLTGGLGDDTFVFKPGYGADAVTDFAVAALDRIDLTAFASIRSFADVLAHASQVGADTVIDLGAGDTLILRNVVKADLRTNDFIGLESVRKDFDGDGRSDLLLLNDTNHAVAIARMVGTEFQASPQSGTINAAGGWRYEDIGDFNGDGQSDLLLLNDTNHGVAVWQMDGSRVEQNPQVGTINAAGGWRYEDIGDFNGDGQSDLLLLNDINHGVAVWQMDGSRVEQNPQVGTINARDGWRYEAMGDFNGDGKSDLLLLNDTNHGVAVWQMDGTRVALNPQVGTVNARDGWRYEAIGDFNGDGKSDLLLLNDTNHGVAIWQMDGARVALNPQVGTINAAAGWRLADLGDYNGNGRTEILWRIPENGQLSTWEFDDNLTPVIHDAGTLDPGQWPIVL